MPGRNTPGRLRRYRWLSARESPLLPLRLMADSTTRSGSSTAIVAVVAILAILALVWFFLLRDGTPGADGGTPDVNIEVNPGGATE